MRLQARAFGPLHDADLAQPTRQLLRRLDVHPERFGICRQRMILGGQIEVTPVNARLRRQRRFEIVSERRTKRRLVARRDADVIDCGRIGTFVGSRQQLGDRVALGRKGIGGEPDALRFVVPRSCLRLRVPDCFFGG